MHLRDYTWWPVLTRLGYEILILRAVGAFMGCALGIPVGVFLAWALLRWGL